MILRIIAVGKLKEQYWKDAEAEYFKRLRPYAHIEVIELKEESFNSMHEKDAVQKKEAEKIQALLKHGDKIFLLHETGTAYTSKEFAKELEHTAKRGEHITFVIGGPLGLHPDFLEKFSHNISLSPLTFPHQMVRTILAEQLYRAVTIMQGKQYHY